MAASTNPNQLSPKVIGAAVAGFIITVLGGALAAITPEALEALGPWAVPAASLLATGGAAVVAWWRTDPLRVNYLTQQKAVEGKSAATYVPEAGLDG